MKATLVRTVHHFHPDGASAGTVTEVVDVDISWPSMDKDDTYAIYGEWRIAQRAKVIEEPGPF